MTQLMLFDASSSIDSVAVQVSQAPRAPNTQKVSHGSTALKADSPVTNQASIPVFDPAVGELHRLGDLARLVLARYDIVAQRREMMRARRLAASNR